MTDALVSSLNLQKGRGAELAWVDSVASVRTKSKDTQLMEMDVDIPDEKTPEAGYFISTFAIS